MAPTDIDEAWRRLESGEPGDEHLRRHRILSLRASAESAPFDVLRTKVLYQMRQQGWKRLAITSALPQSGKTTTACNLALGMGRQPELRSMLFDLDLRSPSVAQTMGLRSPDSIVPLLLGERDFSQHAMRLGSNLALAMSGSPESDPTRILMADTTRDSLNRIQQEYQPDTMIFDLPSILVGDDTRAFLQHVDCALIVVRANETRFAQFDACEREVGEYTNVLGVVLNGYRYGDPLQDDGGDVH